MSFGIKGSSLRGQKSLDLKKGMNEIRISYVIKDKVSVIYADFCSINLYFDIFSLPTIVKI